MSTRFHTRTKILTDTIITCAHPGEHPETDDFFLTRPGQESSGLSLRLMVHYSDTNAEFIGATAADVRALYGGPLIALERQFDYSDILKCVQHATDGTYAESALPSRDIAKDLGTSIHHPKVADVVDVLGYLVGEVTLIDIHGDQQLNQLSQRLAALDLMIQRRGHPRRTHDHGAHDRGAHDQNTDEIIGQLWRDYEAITTALISFSSTTNPATQKQEDTIIAAAVDTVTAKVADLEDTLHAVHEQVTDAASQAAQTRLIEALGLDMDAACATSADADQPRDPEKERSEVLALIREGSDRGDYARELFNKGTDDQSLLDCVRTIFGN